MVSATTERKMRQNSAVTKGTSPQGDDARAPLADVADAFSERLAHLLAIAKATFGNKGYAATTMDDIAGAAGMSKKTLYKLFDSKSDLFRAMLTDNLQRLRVRVNAPPSGSAVEELRQSMRHIADVVFAPEEIALHRLIIAERKQSPALAGIFTDVIFDSGNEGVIDCIRHVRLRPPLRELPSRTVGEMIVGAVFGHDHFRAMVDEDHKVNRRLVNKRIDVAIATFCDDAQE